MRSFLSKYISQDPNQFSKAEDSRVTPQNEPASYIGSIDEINISHKYSNSTSTPYIYESSQELERLRQIPLI